MRFDPEKSLFDLSAVRWVAAATIILALGASLTIAESSNLKFNPDYLGFNSAINIFKVPLGTLAVGLSIIGIFGANHRSEQTKRQIERTVAQVEITKSQNNFANYYKHIEEFEKFCTKIKPDDIEYSTTRDLYRILFIGSRTGDFLLSKEASEKFTSTMLTFIKHVFELGSDDLEIYQEGVIQLMELHKKVLNTYSLVQTIESETSAVAHLNGKEVVMFDTSYAIVLSAFRSLFRLIDKVLHFDIEYESPKVLDIIDKMDLAGYRGRRINLTKPDPLEFDQIFDERAIPILLT
jgi:hypothetical protein